MPRVQCGEHAGNPVEFCKRSHTSVATGVLGSGCAHATGKMLVRVQRMRMQTRKSREHSFDILTYAHARCACAHTHTGARGPNACRASRL